MQTQARRDTSPELAFRCEVHKLGLRYFVHRRPLPAMRREADLVFPRAQLAVFVDGCFWHGCPDHGRVRHVENAWYWPEKIASNIRRDRDTDERLDAAGWISVRVWEHDDPRETARALKVLIDGVGLRPSS